MGIWRRWMLVNTACYVSFNHIRDSYIWLGLFSIPIEMYMYRYISVKNSQVCGNQLASILGDITLWVYRDHEMTPEVPRE